MTRRHAECKGGKVPLLDRILWLSGVKALLGADASYLVLPEFETEASDFARSLGVQLLNMKQLEAWEAAIPVAEYVWPCRSDYHCYDLARESWMKISGDREASPDWRFLRETLGFIEVDSWLRFHYRHLNRAFRLLDKIAGSYHEIGSDKHRELCSRYLFSALLVRLGQYLIAVCNDVSRLPPTDVETYLHQRLVYGDHDPLYVSGLIDGTVDLVKRALQKKGVALPEEVDIKRLYEPPQYAAEFLELVNRLLERSNESRYVPIAIETSQFGVSGMVARLPRLKAASTAGDSLAALVKGFVIRAFSVPSGLSKPVYDDLKMTYSSKSEPSKASHKKDQTRLPFPKEPKTPDAI
ncbi:MAG: hypothetical protein NTU41_08720 [Chloroflexi bacterium]|nr:hypothetical protein [Chloroflexota bacterium]